MLPIVAGIVANLINNGMHKVADQVIEQGVDAVQQKLGIELKPEGEATPEYNKQLSAEAMKHEEFMAELDEKSTQRATDMQLIAMQSNDWVIRRFNYQMAWFLMIVSSVYFGAVSFLPIDNHNRDFVNIILGFLISQAVTSVLRFFYGAVHNTDNKKMTDDK
jgi:hypothetical protein